MEPVLEIAFEGLLGLLLLASGTTAALGRLHPARSYRAVQLRIRTWWVLAALLLLALGTNRAVAVALMTVFSALAFREFLALMPARPSDGPVRWLAYLAVPVQYLWVYLGWYELFLVFIPVYVFLLLPLVMVLIGETKGFGRAAGTLHWGLLLTVFGLSHVAYLLALPARAGAHGPVRGELLVFFLLVLTQLNDVAQFLVGKWLGRRQIAPRVSPGKTVEGLLGGLVVTTLLAWGLGPWLTPLRPLYAVLAGLLISTFGFVGDVVVSALKRDSGVKDAGRLLPGHGGILDRLDSLTYTAPLFFHFVYYCCY